MGKYFRQIGWAEGLSLLFLLGIAMPLKYVAGIPEVTKFVGMLHGILFLLYVFVALQLSAEESWPRSKLAWAVILSCLPFGTFIFERRFLSSELSV